MKRWRQTHEKIYPYLWSVIAAVIVYYYRSAFNLHLSEAQISNTTTVASILMGFLGTSYGILLSATTRRIEWAKGRTRIWRAILRFFNESFIASFILCIYSIALSFLVVQALSEKQQHLIITFWAFLFALSIVSFFRAMRILLGLLKSDKA